MKRIYFSLVALLLAGCGGGSTSGGSIAMCSDPAVNATYDVIFNAAWSAATHPMQFPSNPHFSPIIGATHNDRYRMFQDGGTATQGIENMSELGATNTLAAEIGGAAPNTNLILPGRGLPVSPGSVPFSFSTTVNHPLVSIVTMIAPSPDWFVGVSALNLCPGGRWANALTVNLRPYDAGTDSGVTYNSPDADITPHLPIRQINGPPFLNGSTVLDMGTFTFIRRP